MADLILSGVIGEEVTARGVQEHLRNHDGDELNVFINSPGGYVYEGLEIYNTLRASGKHITTVNTGVCASIASVIFLAGDDRVAMEGTEFMIHKPSGVTWGNSDDIQKEVEVLDKTQEDIERIYASRTNIDDISNKVNAESWFNVDEMAEKGITNSDKEVIMMTKEEAVNVEELKAQLEAAKVENAKLQEDKQALEMKAELDKINAENAALKDSLQDDPKEPAKETEDNSEAEPKEDDGQPEAGDNEPNSGQPEAAKKEDKQPVDIKKARKAPENKGGKSEFFNMLSENKY